MTELTAIPGRPTAPSALRSPTWLGDFRVRGGRIEVLDTGARLRLDRTLVGEALVWLGYHLVVRLRALWMRAARRRAPAIWFSPMIPRPWYLVWSAAAWAGLRIAASPETADFAFAFEDATWMAAGLPMAAPAFNGRCRDISKSRVAQVFEAVFDYPLAVDPTTWTGPAVEKGEVNGVHDGRIVNCPTLGLPSRCYQRLIDTAEAGVCEDLRTACVGGRPVAVWIKRKPQEGRFSIHNARVTQHAPEAVFSPWELERIAAFLAAMGADWAGLDILRDRASGRIYIVDVNKTDVGPIIALPLADKLRSTAMLARALDAMLRGRPAA